MSVSFFVMVFVTLSVFVLLMVFVLLLSFVLLSVVTELPPPLAVLVSVAPANGENPKVNAIAAVVIITFFMFVMTSS